jgi:hypothetical protein
VVKTPAKRDAAEMGQAEQTTIRFSTAVMHTRVKSALASKNTLQITQELKNYEMLLEANVIKITKSFKPKQNTKKELVKFLRENEPLEEQRPKKKPKKKPKKEPENKAAV